MRCKAFLLTVCACATLTFVLWQLPQTTEADHAWANYHWARTTSSFTLKVIDSHTSDWDDNFNRALSDWSRSSVLDLVREAGDSTQKTRKRCAAETGKVRSCNAAYGFNGWLGLATISISGNHITRGTSKMNDSYFASPSYDEVARSHVVCQEIGHTFGLGHQDESGADFNTCMDYSNDLDNPSPNAHDYAQLEAIYSHVDTTTTIASLMLDSDGFGDDPDAPHHWGRLVSQSANGRSSTYEHVNMNGTRTVRHVFWTEEAADRCRACDHRYDRY